MMPTSTSVPPIATRIMLIRHAEKPPSRPPPYGIDVNGDQDPESVIPQGWQRAGALVVFFAPSAGPFQNSEIATPATIYASQVTTGSDSKRPQETVTPLIAKLGSSVAVNFDFPKGQEKEVGSSALACTGVVLICWEHHSIPKITKHFPISVNNTTPVPTEWPDDRYDVVWIFDLDSTGAYCFYEEAQLLLAGDTTI